MGYSIFVFGIFYVFIASLVFFILSIILGFLFKIRNSSREKEIKEIIESSRTKEEELIDDSELVAVISAAISSYMSHNKFIIKSIKESKSSMWGLIDRLGNNK